MERYISESLRGTQMKIHLHQNPTEELNGYTNICLGDDVDGGEITNRNNELDAVVDSAEAMEIVADNVLEFIPIAELMPFLEHVIGKLRHKGTLIITGVDAYTVAKDYVSYKLSIEEFNFLLHGNQCNERDVKMTTLTLHGMVSFLSKQCGLKIIGQQLEEYNYVIEVQRP